MSMDEYLTDKATIEIPSLLYGPPRFEYNPTPVSSRSYSIHSCRFRSVDPWVLWAHGYDSLSWNYGKQYHSTEYYPCNPSIPIIVS